MKRFVAGLAATGALFGGCGGEQAPQPTPPAVTATTESVENEWLDMSDGSLPETEKVQTKANKLAGYIAAAEFVADTTGNKRAQELVRFAHSHAVPSVVTKLGPVALHGKTVRPEQFAIISLGEDDKGLNPISDDYLQANGNGVFTRKFDSLFIYENAGFSENWLGILTLHELNHAKNDLTNATPDPLEEVKTRRFQHELAAALFGDAYKKILDDTIEQIESEFDEFIDNNGALIIPKVDASNISSKSARETRWANTTLLFHAIFSLLDKKLGPSDMTPHQRIYDTLISQMLPTKQE